jgi:hypothetical protein
MSTSASTYTPAYALPNFTQSLPGDPDTFQLIEGGPKRPTLQYRDKATGAIHTVPNLPCNQQRSVQIEVLEWYADQHDARARQALILGPRGKQAAEHQNELAKTARRAADALRKELSLIQRGLNGEESNQEGGEESQPPR